jgi:signal transduction histidine kinase
LDSNPEDVEPARKVSDAGDRTGDGRSLVLEAAGWGTRDAKRAKSEFLSHLSYELRTPLNAIIGFAELMFKGKVGPISDDHKEYLGDILDSSRHLLQLFNDVLDIAQLELGNMEVRTEPIEPGRVVAEVRASLGGLAASKRIRVETELDPTVAEVVLDPSNLRKVLYNYLSNALKFTSEDGHVTIRVVHEALEYFRIEVEDTGVGISDEDALRLFVAFPQFNAGTAKRTSGSGLGLALTKRIAEAQGGHVGARSELGKGSTFWAVLPRGHQRSPAT